MLSPTMILNIRLENKLVNISHIKLESIQIPTSWYTFD